MPSYTLKPAEIESYLDHLTKKLDAAKAWVTKQKKDITLDVPQPFEHALGPDSRGPVSGKGCPFPPPPDECGYVGIALAVFQVMP